MANLSGQGGSIKRSMVAAQTVHNPLSFIAYQNVCTSVFYNFQAPENRYEQLVLLSAPSLSIGIPSLLE